MGKTFFFPAGVRDFSLLQSINTASETQPFSNLMGTNHSFHLMVRLRSEAICALPYMPYDTCKDISYYSAAYLSVPSAAQDIVVQDDL